MATKPKPQTKTPEELVDDSDISSSPEVGRMSLSQRLYAVKSAIGYIQKEETRVQGKYRPLSRNTIVGSCRPFFQKYKLQLTFSLLNYKIEEIKIGQFHGFRFDGVWQCFLASVGSVGSEREILEFTVHGCGTDQLDKYSGKARSDAEKNAYISLLQLEYGEHPESDYSTDGSDLDDDVPAPAKVLTIGSSQVRDLQDLAAQINVDPSIVARSAGVPSIELIPVAKYPELHARLTKKANELSAAKAN